MPQINDLISKPKTIRNQLVDEVYKNINKFLDNRKNSGENENVLNISSDHSHPLNNTQLVIPKDLIVANSTQGKNNTIENFNNYYSQYDK